MSLTERIARGPDRRQADRRSSERPTEDRRAPLPVWRRRQLERGGGDPHVAVADLSERSVA